MPRIKKSTNKQKSTEKLKASLYNLQGEVVGDISLPEKIFAAKINPILMAQAVRIYQANQRLGTHSTKTRGEVTGSTRKIYRQKGTGRARHGDIKSPIFIGGGVVHGPRPKDYSLSFPKKMRKLALFSALTSKYRGGAIKIISGLKEIEAKTKNLVETLVKLKLIDGKKVINSKILLVIPNKLDNILLAGRNLRYLTIRQAQLLNTYEILSHYQLVLMEETVTKLVENAIGQKQSPNLKSPITTSQKPEDKTKKLVLKKKSKTSLTKTKRISDKK
ncbi:50S ribosomal protein L4 [Candidatus Gottesmanbacteria bacterium RIFCSPLOWO2_01_FULL_39_12b]|uniref:Large ribosomal subunit protein uL4 n=1 Tax=Candidatus Gottesmanbacteria bacterium RIFCSPLOWO2_01_FULL_39_12b TaxID=1798388 RepID=A0A1F6ARI2_9BACT|nr:MAG: 50S ribosomal protein L4 [Candidatus Gottesmanbacteria bacterium RIFCSPLOWO2_01_FULL_39_12b]